MRRGEVTNLTSYIGSVNFSMPPHVLNYALISLFDLKFFILPILKMRKTEPVVSLFTAIHMHMYI